MDRWVGKVAIVTGASSGIGEAIAESLVKAGMLVVGLARRVEKVEALAATLASCPGKLHALKCDMTCEEDIIKAFEWTTKNVGLVHILINNAGVVQPTNLIAGETAKWRTMFDTNVMGLCIATREGAKIMMENKIAGHIVHINSIAGQAHLYFPTISVYGATKHAVSNLTEVLRKELVANKSQIKVTSVSPGAVKTEIITKQAADEGLPAEFKEMLLNMPILESQDIADAVLYVLGTPPHVQVNELTIRPIGSEF